MPDDSGKNKVVLIRRPAADLHAARHGGSWKVAYADLVTAMMAFFLLLWLLTMLEPEKRGRVAEFFTDYNLIQSLKGEGAHSRPEAEKVPPAPLPRDQVSPQVVPAPLRQATSEEISTRLAVVIESRLADLKDQVLIERDPDGLRIEVVDREGRLLFQKGDAQPTAVARRVLKVLGEALVGFENKVAITGHADALPFTASSRYTNWDLSTFRALAARRELDAAGLHPGRLVRVSGAADVDPLIKQDPSDPRNRRISLRVLAGPTLREQREPSTPFPPGARSPGP